MLETLQQFIVFCDESYSVSPHDLALFVMTSNYNIKKITYVTRVQRHGDNVYP